MKTISLTLFLLFANSLLAIVFLFNSCNTKKYTAVFTSFSSDLKDNSKPGGAVMMLDTCTFGSTSVFLKLNYQVLNAFTAPMLTNSAYALQVAEPQTLIVEQIEDIRVIALHDYNATISEGDDVSAKVSWQIDRYGYGQGGSEMTKEEFLTRISGQMEGSKSNNYRNCSFKFKEAPTFVSRQQFAIELQLYGGTKLQDTTIAFVLHP